MQEMTGGKFWLFIIAVASGMAVSSVIYTRSLQLFPAALLGIGVALLYPLIAAGAVGVCSTLRRFSFPDSKEDWSSDEKAYLGAFWPVSLLFWLIISPFFAIINRVFR